MQSCMYLLLVDEGLVRWKTCAHTCCWWMRVCLSRTLLMLCSIAYFLALVTASLWEKDSLAGVNSFCSRFPPGPCTSEPDCGCCGSFCCTAPKKKMKREIERCKSKSSHPSARCHQSKVLASRINE